MRRNKPQRNRPERPRPQVEVLEARDLPAGDVTAILFGGSLVVVGDHADNAVEVLIADGNLVVQGRAGTGTTVNGGTRTVFEGVGAIGGSLVAFLGGGNDRLDVRGVAVGRDAVILADRLFADFKGGGDDEVRVEQVTVGGDLIVSTDGGADAVVLDRSTVADDTLVTTGSGNDRFSLVAVSLGDRLVLDTGSGDDRAFLDPAAASGDVLIQTGSGNDNVILHGVNTYQGEVVLDGGRGRDRAAIDPATTFAGGRRVRGFEKVVEAPVTEFSLAEGLSFRLAFLGQPPGTGSTVFALNGANFSGGEVTVQAVGAAYASPPGAYVPGPGGATVTFDAPAGEVRFFFTHLPGDTPGTATAFDADGNVVATAQSNAVTFVGDPGNFVTLSGARPIARVVVTGGMIDNLSWVA